MQAQLLGFVHVNRDSNGCFAINPDGSCIVAKFKRRWVGTSDNNALIRDVGDVTSISASDDCRVICVTRRENTSFIAVDGYMQRMRACYKACVSPNGQYCILNDPDGLFLYAVYPRYKTQIFHMQHADYYAYTFTPDSKRFIAGRVPSLFDVESHHELLKFDAPTVHLARVTPNGKHVVFAGIEALYICSMDTGKLKAKIVVPGAILSLAVSNTYAVTSDRSSAIVWSFFTCKQMYRIVRPGIMEVKVTADGTKILICGELRTIYMFEVRDFVYSMVSFVKASGMEKFDGDFAMGTRLFGTI